LKILEVFASLQSLGSSPVSKLLANINPSKASGPDNIPNRILKECAIHLAPILKTILL
jgi:hypothetical protein